MRRRGLSLALIACRYAGVTCAILPPAENQPRVSELSNLSPFERVVAGLTQLDNGAVILDISNVAILPAPMTVTTHDRELDARGLNCPLPILRARKALNEMASGQVLRIVATDPGSVRDFEVFAKQTGHTMLSQSADPREFVFYLRKK